MLTIYAPDLRQTDFGLEPPSQASIQHDAYEPNIAVEQDGRVPNLQHACIHLGHNQR